MPFSRNLWEEPSKVQADRCVDARIAFSSVEKRAFEKIGPQGCIFPIDCAHGKDGHPAFSVKLSAGADAPVFPSAR